MNRTILNSLSIFSLLSILILGLFYNIQIVEANETIYIRADGQIEPPTAPISTTDNFTYYITNNINEPIVVERNNIIINGDSYTIQGTGNEIGINLYYVNNVTIG